MREPVTCDSGKRNRFYEGSAGPATRRAPPERLFALDAGRLDDRPPFFDLGLLQGGELLPASCSRGKNTRPSSVRCVRTAGSARAATTAPLSRSTIGRGVSFGAHSAFHTELYRPGTPADFGRFIADETDKWSKVVKFSRVKAD